MLYYSKSLQYLDAYDYVQFYTLQELNNNIPMLIHN